MALTPLVDKWFDNPTKTAAAQPLEDGVSVGADDLIGVQVVGEGVVRSWNLQAGDGVDCVALARHQLAHPLRVVTQHLHVDDVAGFGPISLSKETTSC